MPRLYRTSTTNAISGTDFMNSVVIEKPCGSIPPCSRYSASEWHCDSSECAVREVRVEAIPDAVAAMNCPACGDPLRFETYLQEARLIPA